MLNLPVVLMILGLVAGMARGGDFRRFFATRFRGFWLVPLALVLQGALEVFALSDLGAARAIAGVVMAASYSALIAFCLLNRELPAMFVVAAGLALNLLVIAANGAMPVSPGAARAAGLDIAAVLRDAVRHELMGSRTRIGWLGDVIPLPGLRTVISAGDCLVGGGLFRFMDKLVRYDPKRLA